MKKILLVILIIISGCRRDDQNQINDLNDKASYLFIESLVNEKTGLVESTENEQFTTVYKNALAAMAFTLAHDYSKAEKIFDFFNSKYDASTFQGFTQYWNPQTGETSGDINYWEGDCSFLLIALNYYKQVKGSYGNYQDMVEGLRDWLAKRGNENDNTIIAEGLIDIFAALKPLESSLPSTAPDVLLKLHSSFLKNAAFSSVGDHIERAALTLGVLDGFNYIGNFEKKDVWE
jgi:hypothetical protein